ncbi:MAG: hypothetical protein RJQ09_03020 [Cyclobacteriaceae bacterium]
MKGPILFALLIFPVVLYGQKDDAVKSLISKHNEINGFGAVDFKYTEIYNEKALIFGFNGGVIINKHIMLGVGGYGLTTEIEVNDDIFPPHLEGGYGGILLGVVAAPVEIVHFTFPVLLGAGSFHIVDRELDFNNFSRAISLESSSFAVVEPGLQVEINISKNFRFAVGSTYRLIQGVSFNDINDSDLSGFTGNITFRVGKF